jgi:phage recombination protein Bet
MNPVRTMALTEIAPAAIAAPTITPEQLALIKQTIAKDATPLELELFLYDNARRGIHPLDKLLHFTKRAGKYTPIVSIDLMRARAAGTGDYAGQDEVIFTGTPKTADFRASIVVYRFVHDQRCPFPATAWWAEYLPDQAFMWTKMPHVMLGKVAEALALRKGFPQELAGLYAAEEMAQAGGGESVDRETGEITNELPPAAPRTISQAQRKRLFAIATKAGWTKGQIQDALQAKFSLVSTEAITTDKYDDICAAFEEAPPPMDPDAPF